MSRKNDLVFYTPPTKRPEPQTLAVRILLDRQMVAHYQKEPDVVRKLVIRDMANQLAAHIAEKCLPFNVKAFIENTLYGDRALEMELTINDRGSYEHWLPEERRQGRKEGAASEKASAPYGIEEGRFE